jgi:NAD(P)-dependent dehydrogenase (short-subunit alcohol dehydrogenase family)
MDEVSKFGIEAIAVEAELSKPDDVESMLQKIDKTGRVIDIVFNDAGVQIAYRNDYYQTPAEDFTQRFLINTIAPSHDMLPFFTQDDRPRFWADHQYHQRNTQ